MESRGYCGIRVIGSWLGMLLAAALWAGPAQVAGADGAGGDAAAGGGQCRYVARRVAPRGGCTACPAPGDLLCADAPCASPRDCAPRLKFHVPCLEGPGTCGVRGRRETCEACRQVAESYFFTPAIDHLVGTNGPDWFDGGFDPYSNIQAEDVARGRPGADVLSFDLPDRSGGTIEFGRFSSIESYQITSFDADDWYTLDLRRVRDVRRISTIGSVGSIRVDRLREIVDMGIEGLADGKDQLLFVYPRRATTAGTDDEFTIFIANTTAASATVETAGANGLETVNLVSIGDSANALSALNQVGGESLTTANFTGSTHLSVEVMPDSVRFYDASHSSGIALGTGWGMREHESFSSGDIASLIGSPEGDYVFFADTLDENDFVDDSPNLRSGFDVVQATLSGAYNPPAPFHNVENFRLSATSNGASMNFRGFTGVTRLTIEEDGEPHGLRLVNVRPIRGTFPTLQFRGNNQQAGQAYDTVTCAARRNRADDDTLTIEVDNRGTSLNATGKDNVHAIGKGPLTAKGFERVNITVTDGPAVFAGMDLSRLSRLTVTGSSDVVLGRVQTAGATLEEVNAAAVSQDFVAELHGLADGATITTGGGNDAITIGDQDTPTELTINLGDGDNAYNGSAEFPTADTIVVGIGMDVINGAAGVDVITTGGGTDRIVFDQFDGGNESLVTDFAVGDGGDVMLFDVDALQLAGSDVYVGAIGGLAPDSSKEIVVLTGAGYPTDEAAEDAVAARVTTDGLDVVIVYFNTTEAATRICQDPDAGFDGSATIKLIGKLTNVTTQLEHDALVEANVEGRS